MITIRKMNVSDIAFGVELCRLSRWNQLDRDWRHLIAHNPDGVFVAEYDGQPCATASAVNYGTTLGWIGMILVHPNYRRKGIASALMTRCIEYLQALNVESIKLDATDQGRPVYLKLGFKDEQPIYRLVKSDYKSPEPAPAKVIAPVNNWQRVAAIDRDVFGADRERLLKLLNEDGRSLQITDHGRKFGYGFARLGFEASFVGPLIASDRETAKMVLEGLLCQLPAGTIYTDMLPQNKQAKELFDSMGFKVARELTRMCLGSPANCGTTEMIYSVAGFELG